MRLEIWREGSTDAALVSIIRRTLLELTELTEEELEQRLPTAETALVRLNAQTGAMVGYSRKPQGKYTPYAKKVLQAFASPKVRKPDTIVVAVWDADRDPTRVLARDQVNSHLREHALTGSSAGVCIQELEAWLLADAGAFRRCFGKGPDSGLSGTPESLSDPKSELNSVLRQLEVGREASVTDTFIQLSACIDLQELREKCPSGYGTLREDLGVLVSPCLL